MKRIFLGISFVAITPVVILTALIFSLYLYHQNYTDKYHVNKRVNRVAYAALPPATNHIKVSITEQDGRSEQVRQFLEKYNSPLEPFSQDIINAADEYRLDYRLLPAIAMQESNLCKKIPFESNNCWGYGIYGGKVTRFPDFKEAIYTVSKTLSLKYKGKGLVTPEQIMTKWTPSSNGSWAYSVNHFMEKLK